MTNQKLKFCIGDIYSKQVSIQQEIQKHGFNVVTCQDCGDVILLKKDDEGVVCRALHFFGFSNLMIQKTL
ncbi:hypothetical protein [Francisella sp. TX07-6608]|uniref:hypothetical protein n=1 Tax=Francisella sp. TX07-6608 TaxID=573568 RepID=UPI0008F99E50|nr:hypothetical protein [Francisella sp. TX07-6608]OIN85030.1 hypothetical protein KX00_2257 [Francisella sp. TX07-6608]